MSIGEDDGAIGSPNGEGAAQKFTDSYEVGYGKPPVSTRFKRGQSGNRAGRKRGSVGLTKLVLKEMDKSVTFTVNGKRKTMTKRQAIAIGLVNSALKNEVKALATILQIESTAERTPTPPDPNAPMQDQWVLDSLRKRFQIDARQSLRKKQQEPGESHE